MSRKLTRAGHGSQRPDCVADDPVSCEPVSAPNSLLTGKLTGNFGESGPPRAHSIVYSRIPCATEQGISKRVSGNIFQGTGNRHADIRRRSALTATGH